MRCAATAHCSTPPRASSACGRCRRPCWRIHRRCGSMRRAHGDRIPSTSSSSLMPGACRSQGLGATPTIRAHDLMPAAPGLTRRSLLPVLAGLALPFDAVARPPAPWLPGLQLFTVRDVLRADMDGTLRRVAEIGYRSVETAEL